MGGRRAIPLTGCLGIPSDECLGRGARSAISFQHKGCCSRVVPGPLHALFSPSGSTIITGPCPQRSSIGRYCRGDCDVHPHGCSNILKHQIQTTGFFGEDLFQPGYAMGAPFTEPTLQPAAESIMACDNMPSNGAYAGMGAATVQWTAADPVRASMLADWSNPLGRRPQASTKPPGVSNFEVDIRHPCRIVGRRNEEAASARTTATAKAGSICV